jgi:DNA mismatch repair protein MutL
MIAVERQEGAVSVAGWTSRAGESFTQARGILTYVNGRLVRDRLLIRAVLDGYRSLLPQGRYPSIVLRVDLPGTALDVNVHPTKTEVRFAHGDAVYGAVVRALRAALQANAVAPGAAPLPSASTSAGERARGDAASSPGASGTVSLPPGASVRVGGVAEALARYARRSEPGAEREPALPLLRGGAAAAADRGVVSGARIPVAAAEEPAGAETTTRGEDSVATPASDAGLAVPRFADLRVVGQAWNGYLICESPTSLVLIDQHAAHERVRFERLRRAAASAGDPPSQRLLEPRIVELGSAALASIAALLPELARAGFDVEPFGERALLVRAVPTALDVTTDAEALLADLADDLAELGASERLQAARDTLLARIACHGAVRVGDPLRQEEMARILSDLDTIPFAATCPHGRPLLLELERSELERRVRRA